MAIVPSLWSMSGSTGLDFVFLPLVRSWPLGIPELDSLATLMLALSLAPAGVLIWGSVGARRFPDLFVLTIFYGGAALVMMAVSNLVFFYLAWEVLGLCCWGIGRWGTSLVGRPGIPANAGIAFGSLCMFGAVAVLAWDSRSLEMAGLRTDSPVLVQRLLLAACLFKAWGILGQAWRPIDPRAFPVSQAILAAGGVVAVGLYPLARFHTGVVDWSVPWQSDAMTAGALVAAIAAVAALGEAASRSSRATAVAPEVAGTAALHRALAYVAFSLFCWNVVMLAIQGTALSGTWVLWVLFIGLAIGGAYMATGLAGAGAIPSGSAQPSYPAHWMGRGRLVTGAIAYLLTAATVLGAPPSVGSIMQMNLSLRLSLGEQHWIIAILGIWSFFVFLSFCRLAVVVWWKGRHASVRWPASLAVASALDLAMLVWLSISGTLPAEIASFLLGQGGQGG